MSGTKLKKRISWRMHHKYSECFRKNKYSHKEHKFFETKNKETFIQKAANTHLVNLMLTQVSAKIDRTSFSMVLTFFTSSLSTIYSFTEVYFTSITSRDGAKILETKKFRKLSSITQENALQTPSLLLKFHWHPHQTQILNRGFKTLLRTGTLIKRKAVQAGCSDRNP